MDIRKLGTLVHSKVYSIIMAVSERIILLMFDIQSRIYRHGKYI